MNYEIPGQVRVIAHYGEDAQSMVHMEECAELIQAISKMRRVRTAGKNDDKAYDNLVEEVADVLICIEQIAEMYSIPAHLIQEQISRKCVRQEDRMNGDA